MLKITITINKRKLNEALSGLLTGALAVLGLATILFAYGDSLM